MKKTKNMIEKKESLNENLRIFAELEHPVRDVSFDELVDLIKNNDGHTIINVLLE